METAAVGESTTCCGSSGLVWRLRSGLVWPVHASGLVWSDLVPVWIVPAKRSFSEGLFRG